MLIKLREEESEQGSLVVAIIIISIIMVLALAIMMDIVQSSDISLNTEYSAKSVQTANAGVADAIYQLDQYDPSKSQVPPTKFCASDATPTPVNCIAVPTHGTDTWTYYAVLTPGASPGVITYKITSTGTVNGHTKTVVDYANRLISHDGLTGLWGVAAAGSLSIVPTNSLGQSTEATPDADDAANWTQGDTDNDNDGASAGVNQGAVACSGLITGTINIYGKSGSGTNCTGTPTGTPPLNPGEPVESLCPPPVATVPPTPCLPADTGNNYAPGNNPSTPTTSTCNSGSYTFTGAINPGIYICNSAVTFTPGVTIATPDSPLNNGVVEIFVFMPSSTPPGNNDVTIGRIARNQVGVNAAPAGSPAWIGNSNDLLIYVSDPNTCSVQNGSITGGGNIYFAGHGSNVAPVSGELFAPNDSFGINGAPFSFWTGNILVCFATFNGGGGGRATMNDNVQYSPVYGNWYASSYSD